MKELEIVDCSHINKENPIWYEAIYYDGKAHRLCKSCYGEILLTVLDTLKSIEVKIK